MRGEEQVLEHPRLRIIWANEETKKRVPQISHWIFNADDRSRPVFYGCQYVAVEKSGKLLRGFQLHQEFKK